MPRAFMMAIDKSNREERLSDLLRDVVVNLLSSPKVRGAEKHTGDMLDARKRGHGLIQFVILVNINTFQRATLVYTIDFIRFHNGRKG